LKTRTFSSLYKKKKTKKKQLWPGQDLKTGHVLGKQGCWSPLTNIISLFAYGAFKKTCQVVIMGILSIIPITYPPIQNSLKLLKARIIVDSVKML